LTGDTKGPPILKSEHFWVFDKEQKQTLNPKP